MSLQNKDKNDDKIHTNKAQMVTKDFKQIHGVNYDETFSLVALFKICSNFTCCRCITWLWNMEDWCKYHLFNGNNLKDVFMTQPEGFCQSTIVSCVSSVDF